MQLKETWKFELLCVSAETYFANLYSGHRVGAGGQLSSWDFDLRKVFKETCKSYVRLKRLMWRVKCIWLALVPEKQTKMDVSESLTLIV